MNPILDWGINFIASVQSNAPWVRESMTFFSFLGTETFYILFLPFLYWCVDARLGLRVGIILCASTSVNAFFKLAFHAPRPYWVSTHVQAMSSEASYGLPSGHAQNAVTVWGTIASTGRRWLCRAMILLIFLISLSRMLLAVHFPTDVLLGWILGGLLLWAALCWEMPFLARFKLLPVGRQIALILVASIGLIAIGFAGTAFLPPTDPAQWETLAAAAYPPVPGQTAIHPRDISGMVGVAGFLFGFATGATLLFHRNSFDAQSEWWKRLLRYVLGVVVVGIIWMGLGKVLPHDTSMASQVLRYLRYALVGIWMGYGAPRMFIRLRL